MNKDHPIHLFSAVAPDNPGTQVRHRDSWDNCCMHRRAFVVVAEDILPDKAVPEDILASKVDVNYYRHTADKEADCMPS